MIENKLFDINNTEGFNQDINKLKNEMIEINNTVKKIFDQKLM